MHSVEEEVVFISETGRELMAESTMRQAQVENSQLNVTMSPTIQQENLSWW